MKGPKIYVIVEPQGDRYHLFSVDLVCWFFDKREAEDWAEKHGLDPSRFNIEEVEAGE